MGRVIRRCRHHLYHGCHPLAQEVVASWVGITQAQLSRIENGNAIVHLDRLIHWAQILGIPGQYLWFALPDRSPTNETEDVKRRLFLTTTSASLAGALVGRVTPPSPAPPSDLARAMLTPSVSDTKPVPVAELTKQVTTAWHLRQRASYEALGQVLPTLLAQAQARVDTGDDAEQSSRVVVHAYNAASSLLRKLGDGPLALVAADRAVGTARALDDPVLIAAALYRLANVLLGAWRPDETKAVALQAADLIEPGKMQTPRSLAMWGGLLLTAAVAAARSADESAAWELLGEARVAGRLLGADRADIYSIFGPTNVAIHGVQVAVELRRGADAVRRSHHVDPDHLPPSLLERRGQFLIDVAHGHVLEGADTPAVAFLLRANDIAPQEVRLSPEVHDLIRTLLGRERIGATPGLRELARHIGFIE